LTGTTDQNGFLQHLVCRSDRRAPGIANPLTLASRIINIAVGVIMILGGIAQFFPPSVGSIVVGAYVIIFGLRKFLRPPPQDRRHEMHRRHVRTKKC
jgi:hypothetical protein